MKMTSFRHQSTPHESKYHGREEWVPIDSGYTVLHRRTIVLLESGKGLHLQWEANGYNYAIFCYLRRREDLSQSTGPRIRHLEINGGSALGANHHLPLSRNLHLDASLEVDETEEQVLPNPRPSHTHTDVEITTTNCPQARI